MFRPPDHTTHAFLLLFGIFLAGCGSSSIPQTATTTTPATSAPSIVTQPASLTVPMGLEGIFSVAVSGNGTLTYQWYRNGVAIPGANALTYTTPTVAAIDAGTIYTFTVSNSLGSATSQPAKLTAGARAPKAGDLRFQQVDALSTVNGHSPFESIGDAALESFLFGNYSGDPLWIASGSCATAPTVPPTPPGLGCFWQFTTYNLPASAPPLAVGYVSDFYSNFESDLSTGEFPATQFGGGSILGSDNVVSSLLINNYNNFFALSYAQNQTGGFDLAQHTILPAQFQAAATQEGLLSRVITALAFDSGQLVYFSYGWTGDTTTIYETQTATATFATAPTVAAALAAQGYIITAMGGDDADGIVMVGTRVQGDALPRPILLATPGANRTPLEEQIMQQGYAVVGAIETQGGDVTTLTKIGER